MCRSIVTLRGPDWVSDEEVTAAALQFVRKISGYRVPSRANQAVFDRAVRDVADATRRLLDDLAVRPSSAGGQPSPSSRRHSRRRDPAAAGQAM
jgi:hypothetical protein